jgi:hypothetical protein
MPSDFSQGLISGMMNVESFDMDAPTKMPSAPDPATAAGKVYELRRSLADILKHSATVSKFALSTASLGVCAVINVHGVLTLPAKGLHPRNAIMDASICFLELPDLAWSPAFLQDASTAHCTINVTDVELEQWRGAAELYRQSMTRPLPPHPDVPKRMERVGIFLLMPRHVVTNSKNEAVEKQMKAEEKAREFGTNAMRQLASGQMPKEMFDMVQRIVADPNGQMARKLRDEMGVTAADLQKGMAGLALPPGMTLSKPNAQNPSESKEKVESTSSSGGVACGRCNKTGAKMRCGRCRSVQYCNQACQSANWALHKATCTKQ